MTQTDDRRDGDIPPGRGTTGPPIVESGHRVRDALISFSPTFAVWIAKILGAQDSPGPPLG